MDVDAGEGGGGAGAPRGGWASGRLGELGEEEGAPHQHPQNDLD